MHAIKVVAGFACLALLIPAGAVAAGTSHKPAAKPKLVNYFGTFGADTWTGTVRGDHAHGGGGDDALTGGGGGDKLWGGFGADTLDGGDGADFLWPGVGTDTVNAGAGNDRVFAGDNDASVDTINCGTGTDTAIARHDDVVATDCERIVRVGEASATPTT